MTSSTFEDMMRFVDEDVSQKVLEAAYAQSYDGVYEVLSEQLRILATKRGVKNTCPNFTKNNVEKFDFADEQTALFSEMHRPLTQDRIEEIIGLKLIEINQRTQLQFLEFLSKRNSDQLKSLEHLSTSFDDETSKLNFLTSFLSLEHGGQEMGEKILAIGERYAEGGVAAQIFRKYAELVDAANSAEEYLVEQFGEEYKVIAREVAEGLLVQGKKTLEDFADAKEEITTQDVLTRLEKVRANVHLFTQFVSTARRSFENFDIHQLQDFSVQKVDGATLVSSDTFLRQARSIYQETLGERAAVAFAKFQQMLPASTIYFMERTDATLRDDEKMLAFMMETRKENGAVNLRALNIDKKYGSIAPGTALLGGIIERHQHNGERIEIEAKPKHAVSYMKKYGFVIDGVYDAGSKKFFTLTSDPQLRHAEYHNHKKVTIECVDQYCSNAFDVLQSAGLSSDRVVMDASFTAHAMTFTLGEKSHASLDLAA